MSPTLEEGAEDIAEEGAEEGAAAAAAAAAGAGAPSSPFKAQFVLNEDCTVTWPEWQRKLDSWSWADFRTAAEQQLKDLEEDEAAMPTDGTLSVQATAAKVNIHPVTE